VGKMSEAKMKHPGGRPLKFKTVEELQKLIDDYFESCFTDKPIIDKAGDVIGVERVQVRPYTITGLAMALDMSREGLLNYQEREQFFDAITRAKMKCHNYAEELAMTSRNPTGVIFNLKNNYGWKDKTETELTVSTGIAERLQRAKDRTIANSEGE
jgi:hypothetical protein